MLNVLVVSQYIEPHTGGAERCMLEVCSRLKNRGINIGHLSAVGGNEKMISPPLRFFSGGFHPFWPGQVDRVLRKLRPDIIFAHFTVPGIVDIAIRRAEKMNIPVCLAYHSDITGPELHRKLLGNVYYRIIGMRTLELAGRIIVSSPEYRSSSPWLAALHRQFDYVMPGVDPVMAKGRPSPSSPYLFFAGKTDLKSKGFDILYRAWMSIKKEFPCLELVAAGTPSRQGAYPGVRFTGRVDSRQAMADLYTSAQVTVLPSTSNAESYGMVLAESLVAGTPVVGSDIGGIPALVRDGVNGCLASPGNVQSLARALAKTLHHQDRLRANILAEREAYLRLFSWDNTTDRILQSLSACAGRPVNTK
ncbi:glycosyltransferase family 4 protein [Desulfonatronospira sp.]|uniref:glycosyltransferase family 4 protein n=1 Tax=Desulfonatronospira sp. TaxID=1962951 RepID=UPI0025BF6540|nr:glycosyltransferase family 4 protein [Desulfonatronospira sp.]